jgi:hypothetical protein
MQGGAGSLEYVVCHVNLRQTLTVAGGGGLGGVAAAEAADGAELSVERGFKYGKDGILQIIGHGRAPEFYSYDSGRR